MDAVVVFLLSLLGWSFFAFLVPVLLLAIMLLPLVFTAVNCWDGVVNCKAAVEVVLIKWPGRLYPRLKHHDCDCEFGLFVIVGQQISVELVVIHLLNIIDLNLSKSYKYKNNCGDDRCTASRKFQGSRGIFNNCFVDTVSITFKIKAFIWDFNIIVSLQNNITRRTSRNCDVMN